MDQDDSPSSGRAYDLVPVGVEEFGLPPRGLVCPLTKARPSSATLRPLTPVSRPESGSPATVCTSGCEARARNTAQRSQRATTGYRERLTALRILTHNSKPTSLGTAIAAIGRIAKTRHLLRLYDNPDFRRRIEAQSRLHKERQELAKRICHGIDGPLPEYHPGLEDRLGALGLVLNAVALFNTIYIQKIIDKLRARGRVIPDNEIRQLSALIHRHIHMRGRFHFELTTESMFVIPDPDPVSTSDGISINGPDTERS